MIGRGLFIVLNENGKLLRMAFAGHSNELRREGEFPMLVHRPCSFRFITLVMTGDTISTWWLVSSGEEPLGYAHGEQSRAAAGYARKLFPWAVGRMDLTEVPKSGKFISSSRNHLLHPTE
jgi:hypothetical protein